MPHCDATTDSARASTGHPDLLRRAFSGYAFGLFSGLGVLLVVCACVAEAIR